MNEQLVRLRVIRRAPKEAHQKKGLIKDTIKKRTKSGFLWLKAKEAD